MSEARDDLVARVRANLDVVRERVRATGRDPDGIQIVAVTKSFGPEAVAAAVAAGLGDVAENYAAELVAKHDAARNVPARWHFLGALQSNKLARLVGRVDVFQSVASPSQATALARRAPGARCYVQVDVAPGAGRNGAAPRDVAGVLSAARDAGLDVEGLMCVASRDPGLAEAQFAEVRRLADALSLRGCSMGMSGDLEAACRAGSTMLRLGTMLFGPRASTSAAVVA